MRGRRSLLAPVRISNYLTPLSRDHLRFVDHRRPRGFVTGAEREVRQLPVFAMSNAVEVGRKPPLPSWLPRNVGFLHHAVIHPGSLVSPHLPMLRVAFGGLRGAPLRSGKGQYPRRSAVGGWVLPVSLDGRGRMPRPALTLGSCPGHPLDGSVY